MKRLLSMILGTVVLASAPNVAVAASPVESEKMTEQGEERRRIVVNMAPNWFESYQIDFDTYRPFLKEWLEDYWTEVDFEIRLSDKESPRIGTLEGAKDADEEEMMLDAVGDHFFDEYGRLE